MRSILNKNILSTFTKTKPFIFQAIYFHCKRPPSKLGSTQECMLCLNNYQHGPGFNVKYQVCS